MKDISPKQKHIAKQLEQYGNDRKSAYLGSIHVLYSKDYPDRLVHFSHFLREVIDLQKNQKLSVRKLIICL